VVTGEESEAQVAHRAARLRLDLGRLRIASSSSLRAVVATSLVLRPDILVVDSIQTVENAELDQPPGSVTQVRECATALVRHAKETGTVVLLVGHVTKDGAVAGPKTLEHVVDAVLTLEGERGAAVRILRAPKNRFGACDETGVFTMRGDGLAPVGDPSAMFLADRRPGAVGSIVFPGLEGSRPVLTEIQALVCPSSLARRVATGVDSRRLSLLLGVLGESAGLSLGTHDVFVAAAGGITVREPAADLAVCLALLSCWNKSPLDARTVAVGEVGLSGEVRRVPGVDRRLAEAARLGFASAITPRGVEAAPPGMTLLEVHDLVAAQAAARRAVGRRDPIGR
jgi:DNA repair protein RadA/Sms